MMSTTTPTHTIENTFLNYTPTQAQAYAAGRSAYPAELYNTIMQHHANTGGLFDNVIDVGCGPGNATRDVALSFQHAAGVDPGVEMTNSARALGGKTAGGEPIRYIVSRAEDCALLPELPAGSLDMITSAVAAHWFNMEGFWKMAEVLVKPGGTVAVWTCSSMYCHPTTPNAVKVQEILHHLECDVLGPYDTPGNRLSREMYDSLVLPWQVSPPIAAFPESGLKRVEWHRDGEVDDDKEFLGGHEVTLDRIGAGLTTSSLVTRWREAHPELAGTDQDCVAQTLAALKQLLGETQKIKVGVAVVLLMFKRS